jgi:hypothetical protein
MMTVKDNYKSLKPTLLYMQNNTKQLACQVDFVIFLNFLENFRNSLNIIVFRLGITDMTTEKGLETTKKLLNKQKAESARPNRTAGFRKDRRLGSQSGQKIRSCGCTCPFLRCSLLQPCAGRP